MTPAQHATTAAAEVAFTSPIYVEVELAALRAQGHAILAGKTALADRYRANMKTWLKVTMLVGLVIIIIGGVMRSYPKTPKTDAGPALIAPSN